MGPLTVRSATKLVILALSFCLPLLAEQKQVQGEGKTPVEIDFPAVGDLRINVCPSGTVVQGTDSNKIRVSYEAEHRSDTDHVLVDLRVSGNSGTVEVRGCPHNNLRIRVEVPERSNLYVRMFAGQLEIQGVRGDKDLELHFGQMNVAIGRAKEYAHADGSVNSGQVDAPAFNVSKGGLFRSFSQEGRGQYRLHAHVGAGQLTLNESGN
jgi:hypothetical protein